MHAQTTDQTVLTMHSLLSSANHSFWPAYTYRGSLVSNARPVSAIINMPHALCLHICLQHADPAYNASHTVEETSLSGICRANETQELELLYTWATLNNLGLNWNMSELLCSAAAIRAGHRPDKFPCHFMQILAVWTYCCLSPVH